MSTDEFIASFRDADLTQSALRVRQYPNVDAAFALQQIEGWQRARTKLPELAAIDGWHWPHRLSLEQCSSQLTAHYKLQLLSDYLGSDRTIKGADLTGGFGIDTFYLSQLANTWHYVEQQEELCQIAAHNFALTGRKRICIHHSTAEAFLLSPESEQLDMLYLDPARRSDAGNKVFRLQDCTPDLTQLYPRLINACRVLLIKLSPMLDISAALDSLPHARQVHIVAVKNEVKELLVLCTNEPPTGKPALIAANIGPNSTQPDRPSVWTFDMDEETAAVAPLAQPDDATAGHYLYEPNAAILKAGAYKLIAERYGLCKAAVNTHLYLSDRLVNAFPGRIFRIRQRVDKATQKSLKGQAANIICRNYPLRPDELKKNLHLRDGGSQYLLAFRLSLGNNNTSALPVVLLCERLD
ncbi:MAG: SAM-dependent methyltransferase [Paludibacteraceae bacterium]|nr:SAM-dependent methyltransferase [Paludibacteraceae bacterium]